MQREVWCHLQCSMYSWVQYGVAKCLLCNLVWSVLCSLVFSVLCSLVCSVLCSMVGSIMCSLVCRTVFRCLSPFKIGIHISLEQSVWADFSWNPFQKCIASICFGPNHSGKKFGMDFFDFCESYFQFLPWNLIFRTYMESNAAVTLQFEDLAVIHYLFLKDVYICWWKSSYFCN